MATWDKISDKYLQIADDEYFQNVWETLLATAKFFENENLHNTGLDVVFCKARLQNVAYSYIYDVERYKDFHGSDEANDKKKAAFLMKWIVKISPFYIGVIDKQYTVPTYEKITPLINSLIAIKSFDVMTGESAINYVADNFVYALHNDYVSVNAMNAMFDK